MNVIMLQRMSEDGNWVDTGCTALPVISSLLSSWRETGLFPLMSKPFPHDALDAVIAAGYAETYGNNPNYLFLINSDDLYDSTLVLLPMQRERQRRFKINDTGVEHYWDEQLLTQSILDVSPSDTFDVTGQNGYINIGTNIRKVLDELEELYGKVRFIYTGEKCLLFSMQDSSAVYDTIFYI